MPQKMQIIIEHYDPETRTVEGTKIDANQKAYRFREKGYNVEEFKKLIRKKFGDEVDIVNKVKKHRDMPFARENIAGSESKDKESGLNTKDIVELMKNKYSD